MIKYLKKLARWILREELDELYESINNTDECMSNMFKNYNALSITLEQTREEYSDTVNKLKSEIEIIKKENEIYKKHFSMDNPPSEDKIEETKIDIRIHKLTLENQKLKDEIAWIRREQSWYAANMRNAQQCGLSMINCNTMQCIN